jgi:hypothetical protein
METLIKAAEEGRFNPACGALTYFCREGVTKTG